MFWLYAYNSDWLLYVIDTQIGYESGKITWMLEGRTYGSKDGYNPCMKIHEQIFRGYNDYSWMIRNRSSHKKHLGWIDWVDPCLHEMECIGWPLMEGGTFSIPTPLWNVKESNWVVMNIGTLVISKEIMVECIHLKLLVSYVLTWDHDQLREGNTVLL